MGFHFPPHVERLRLQSNLELEHQLPRDSNVVALPLGNAREEKVTAEHHRGKRKASVVRLVSRTEDENSPAA
jgi:hypothetical protein